MKIRENRYRIGTSTRGLKPYAVVSHAPPARVFSKLQNNHHVCNVCVCVRASIYCTAKEWSYFSAMFAPTEVKR